MRLALRVFGGVVAAPLLVVAACGSDDPSPGNDGPPAHTDGGAIGDATAPTDGADRSDGSGGVLGDGGTSEAGQAAEGMVRGLGTFGAIDLSGLTNALSEVTTGADPSGGTELQVVLAQYASCGDVTAGPSASAVFLELSLYTAGPANDAGTRVRTAATAPGTYDLDLTTAGPYADAYVIGFDPTCQAEASSGKLDAGTVTVTSVTSAGVTGTYHLMSADGVVTGAFSTVPCAGAYDLVAPTSTAGCHAKARTTGR